MTNDGWGSKWPSKDWISEAGHDHTPWPEVTNWPLEGTPPALTGLDLGVGERAVLTTLEHDGIKHKVIHQTELKQQGSNLIDNNCHLYFQCEGCDTILDPHTKSFRVLQEHRVTAGWKCIWNINGLGYKVYCKQCREKI